MLSDFLYNKDWFHFVWHTLYQGLIEVIIRVIIPLSLQMQISVGFHASFFKVMQVSSR